MIFWIVGWRRGRTKNNPKWKIKITSVTHRILKKVAYDHDFWCICVTWYLQVFFHVSKLWCWWIGRKKNGPKWNSPKCPSRSISQEPYIIWLSFMVHLCKMVIAPGVFFHSFKILIFWVHMGAEGQKTGWKGKKWPKMTKKYVCLNPHLRNRTSYGNDFWYTRKIMISLAFFFLILIFLVFRGGRSKRAKNDLDLTNSVYFALYLRNCGLYQDFDNMSRSFSLLFLKMHHCEY